MEDTRYGMRVELPVSYEEAIEKATVALKTEGFGVLTTIDVKQTMKQKLDKDFRKYTILGACNPPIAYRALSTETEIGLLLPCNVIVYETEPGHSVVAAVAPLATMGRVGNEALEPVGMEVDAKLRRVLTSLEGGKAGV
ncbi:MAG TPA: DUF302 domain-containing protein [Vicinamibacterales bacterium]